MAVIWQAGIGFSLVRICQSTRHSHGKAAIISDDYFDEQIVRATELAEPEDTTRGNILAEAGYEQVYDIDEIITRMPTPDEVVRLYPSERQWPSTSVGRW